MKTMREKGDLGEIYLVIGSYLQDWLFFDTDYNWRLEPEKSGNSRAIADIGSHLMDKFVAHRPLQFTGRRGRGGSSAARWSWSLE